MPGKLTHQGGESFGSCVCAYYVIFQFSHACIRPFCPQITKDYKTFSMCLQNKDKTETQNALCNFSESPHMFRSPDHMAWCIMRLVHFALYKWLAVCACGCGSLGCLCVLGLYGRLESEIVSLFDGLVYL